MFNRISFIIILNQFVRVLIQLKHELNHRPMKVYSSNYNAVDWIFYEIVVHVLFEVDHLYKLHFLKF